LGKVNLGGSERSETHSDNDIHIRTEVRTGCGEVALVRGTMDKAEDVG
jgi:hypothetical protein